MGWRGHGETLTGGRGPPSRTIGSVVPPPRPISRPRPAPATICSGFAIRRLQARGLGLQGQPIGSVQGPGAAVESDALPTCCASCSDSLRSRVPARGWALMEPRRCSLWPGCWISRKPNTQGEQRSWEVVDKGQGAEAPLSCSYCLENWARCTDPIARG